MHKTIPEAVALARALREGLEREPTRHEVVVMPPFTALAAVNEVLKGSPIALGAQNMHWEREGAFTGEISPLMLRDVGCTYVILGHSERRHIFDETDERLSRKSRAAFDHGITPMVCVGETLAERESNRTLEVVERQVDAALRPLKPEEVARMVISYEPVWAIGTGRTATAAQAGEAHAHIRKRLRQWFGADPAERCRVIYGGSVKPDNIRELMDDPDVDGALVGGASLDVGSFGEIVTKSRQATV
jgi:triosephosphate isomerase (TIM)